ncbi:MAG: ABC transporter permease DevC [Leptolyngbyaceae cyanobacterium]
MKNWLNNLKRRTPLGWLQLSRHKGRFLVALSGIAFADLMMFLQLGFQESLYESNTRIRAALSADLILVSPEAETTQKLSTFTRRRLFQAQDIPGVASAHALYSNNINWNHPETNEEASLQVIGFDPEFPAFNLPEMNAQLYRVKVPDVVLFDRGARGDYSQTIAQVENQQWVSTEAEGRTLSIRGLFSLGASFGTDGLLITSSQNFLQLFPRRDPGSVSIGLLHVEPGYDPEQVAQALQAHLPNDVEAMTLEDFVQDELQQIQTESPIGFIFTIGAAMAFVVGVVIVYQVLSTDVNAHLKEYATFKAMGYRLSYILTFVFVDSLSMAFLGFIPGLLLPMGVYHIAATATALPIYMTVNRAVTVLIMTLLMCLFSGAVATNKLRSADPADMF